jgi:hypothetical protein
MQRGTRREQTVIVVDEVRIAVVDPLMIGHVRIGRMDAHAFRDDLVQRPPFADKDMEHLARAHLVACHDALLKPGIEPRRLATARRVRVHVHAGLLPMLSNPDA